MAEAPQKLEKSEIPASPAKPAKSVKQKIAIKKKINRKAKTPGSGRPGMAKIQAKVLASGKGPRKPHRYKPGTVALREIRREQKSVELRTTHASVDRLFREIMTDCSDTVCCVSREAVNALREGGEDFLIKLLDATQKVALHAGHITIMPKDMKLVCDLQNIPRP